MIGRSAVFAVLLAWALYPIVLLAIAFLIRRRNRVRPEVIRERTPEHQAMLEMVTDWLDQESIQKALVTTGTVTGERLEKLHEAMSGMQEHELVVTVAVLTRDRRVRQVIARHLVRKFPGTTQYEAMKGLLAFHEGGSGKVLEREAWSE